MMYTTLSKLYWIPQFTSIRFNAYMILWKIVA